MPQHEGLRARSRWIQIRTWWEKFPEAIILASLTAMVTIILALVVTAFVGKQAQDERAATRCYAAITVAMIRDVMEVAPSLQDLADRYPDVNVEGLACGEYLVTPITETPTQP